MPRSSHGSRRATHAAIAQKPRPLARVVRLGRAANDNARQPNLRARLIVAGSVLALAALAVLNGWLI